MQNHMLLLCCALVVLFLGHAKALEDPMFLKNRGLSLVKMALFADVAYDVTHYRALRKSDKSGRSKLIPSHPIVPPQSTPFTFYGAYSIGNTEFVVLYDDLADHLVLAFRGTAGLGDAIDDAKARKVTWSLNAQLQVHEGFMEQYEKGRKDILDVVSEHLEEGVKLISIAGHSLGGALATMAAVDLSREFPDVELAVATFGSPRAGDPAFAAHYRSLPVAQRTIRVVNREPACLNGPHVKVLGVQACQDKVTLVPPDGPFEHVVDATILDAESGFNYHVGPEFELKMHSLTTYEATVWVATQQKNEDL